VKTITCVNLNIVLPHQTTNIKQETIITL